MKNTIFIRRIDSMGRIVIPKDLRNVLNIKEDDNLELALVDNFIKITKSSCYEVMKKVIRFIDLSKNFISGILWLYTNEEFNTFSIPDFIKNVVVNRKDYYSSNEEKININGQLLTGYFAIVPLITDSELIGIFVIQKSEIINELDKLYVQLVKGFVENISYL